VKAKNSPITIPVSIVIPPPNVIAIILFLYYF